MGMFTPVSARTASTALRKLHASTRSYAGRSRTFSLLGQAEPISRFMAGSDSDGDERWRGGTRRSHRSIKRNSINSLAPPTICLTHSSFQAPSVLNMAYSHSPTHDSSHPPSKNVAPAGPVPRWPNPTSQSARTLPTPAPASHRRTMSDPCMGAFPPLDPTLAALEKSCRLQAQVRCAACGTVGCDFPKDRQGRAICSRECRMALKATEAQVGVRSVVKGETREGAMVPILRAV